MDYDCVIYIYIYREVSNTSVWMDSNQCFGKLTLYLLNNFYQLLSFVVLAYHSIFYKICYSPSND
jgi:hypothetical protein